MTDLKERQEEEMRLWRRWSSGDTDALGPLMKSYEPIVHQWANRLGTSPLPKIFIETEIKKQILDSFETFDPKREVKLSTYVNSRLPKVLRNTVYSYGNLGRIPEERQRLIWTYQSAKDRLEEKLRRTPSAMEIADDLNWDLKQVERMEKELRPSRMLTEEGDFSFLSDNRDQKALSVVYHALPAPQQMVFEHHFGWAGKPHLADPDLAKKLKIDMPALKEMKKNLADQIQKALEIV